MKNISNVNGLMSWNEGDEFIRTSFKQGVIMYLSAALTEANKAFEFREINTPILTSVEDVDECYKGDIFMVSDTLCLRPETTKGTYAYAKALMASDKRRILPICIYQSGKSFRKEQDQPTKFMRLKEFHQLELQILFHESTKCDYYNVIEKTFSQILGTIEYSVEPSDRLPNYANWTKDIVAWPDKMEVCSISERTDFPMAGVACLEVSFGLDRIVYVMRQQICDIANAIEFVGHQK